MTHRSLKNYPGVYMSFLNSWNGKITKLPLNQQNLKLFTNGVFIFLLFKHACCPHSNAFWTIRVMPSSDLTCLFFFFILLEVLLHYFPLSVACVGRDEAACRWWTFLFFSLSFLKNQRLAFFVLIISILVLILMFSNFFLWSFYKSFIGF